MNEDRPQKVMLQDLNEEELNQLFSMKNHAIVDDFLYSFSGGKKILGSNIAELLEKIEENVSFYRLRLEDSKKFENQNKNVTLEDLDKKEFEFLLFVRDNIYIGRNQEYTFPGGRVILGRNVLELHNEVKDREKSSEENDEELLPSEKYNFVHQYYRMDPATDTVINDTSSLEDGMMVLVQNPSQRVMIEHIDNTDIAYHQEFLHDALIKNRWCIVTNVYSYDEKSVFFTGIYEEGLVYRRVYQKFTAWIVKKDSLPQKSEVEQVEDESDVDISSAFKAGLRRPLFSTQVLQAFKMPNAFTNLAFTMRNFGSHRRERNLPIPPEIWLQGKRRPIYEQWMDKTQI